MNRIQVDKARDLTQSYDKSPNTKQNCKKKTKQIRHQNVDDTTIADRLMMVR